MNLAAGILGGGLLVAVAVWIVAASVQQDFAAYYTAGRARALGLDPYVNHLGEPGAPWDGLGLYRHSRFLYPPLLAELFRPLAALPFAWAKAAFTALSLLALVGALAMAGRDVGPAAGARRGPTQANLGFVVLAAALWPPVFLALERGQIDLLLLPLLVMAWRLRERRPAMAAACLAFCALAKPSVLAVLPVAALVGGRRALWMSAATVAGVVLFLGAGAVASGPDLSRKYLGEVLPRAAQYGEGGPEELWLEASRSDAVSDDVELGVARIDGRGRTYAQGLGDFLLNASLSRSLAAGDAPPAVLSLGIFVVLGGALALGARRRRDVPAWFWGTLTAGILAAPVSWAMSLTWAFPLLMPLFAAPWLPPLRQSWSTRRAFPIAAAAMFAFGFLGLAAPGGWTLAGIAAVATAVLYPGASSPTELSREVPP